MSGKNHRWVLIGMAGVLAAGIACAEGIPEITPSARIQFDAVSSDLDGEASAWFLRGARFGATARWADGLVLKTEFDVAGDELEWENLYAGWSDEGQTFTLGERKVPGSLERATSAGSLLFAERSAPVDALTDSSRLGLYHAVSTGGWSGQTMLYAGSANQDDGQAQGVDGLAHRFVVHSGAVHGEVSHVAFSAGHERRVPDGRLRFDAGPEVRVGGARQTDWTTGESLDAVDGLSRVGAEAARQCGGWTAQAEALAVRIHQDSAPSATLHGGHLQGAWRPSGHPRTYDGARFGDPQGLDAGGAWEFLIRYSRLDLRDAPAARAVHEGWTAGVNWHGDARWVVKANVLRNRVRDRSAGPLGAPSGGLPARTDRYAAVFRVQLGL